MHINATTDSFLLKTCYNSTAYSKKRQEHADSRFFQLTRIHHNCSLLFVFAKLHEFDYSITAKHMSHAGIAQVVEQ